MMKRRSTFALIAIGLVVLLIWAGPVLAKGGKNTGEFSGTRCVNFTMVETEEIPVDDYAGNTITRLVATGQYSEWTVMSENMLVAGLFIGWNGEGNLGKRNPYGPGAYKGSFFLIPEAANGLWEGNWIIVFKADGNKVFTGEGVGRGGQLEGLIIKIYYETGPGGTPKCINDLSESFNGYILRSDER
jgi:hypothetical protein